MPVSITDINDKGGNKIAIVELDNDFVVVPALAEGTNCLDLGLLASSEIEMKANKEEFKSEDGVIRQTSYEYLADTTGILMEINKQVVDFLCYSVRNRIYLEYKYLGIRGGKYQEMFKIVKVTPQMKLATPGGAKSMPYESTAICPTNTVVISAENITAIKAALMHVGIKTPGPVVIGGNIEFTMMETDVV